MRLGEGLERGHIGAAGAEGAEDVLAEGKGVEFEVGFEEEVGGVVEGPFAGVFERGSVGGGGYLP